MKKFIILLVATLSLGVFLSCDVPDRPRHSRSVILYSLDGKEIMKWDDVRGTTKRMGGYTVFHDKDWNKITIDGGIIITAPSNYTLPEMPK